MPRESKPAIYVARHLLAPIEEALEDTRVVVINGARQAGKSTLASRVAAARGGEYETLDNPTALSAARNDPVGFLERAEPFVIDELQRGGDQLLLAIKANVDRDPRPGRFTMDTRSRPRGRDTETRVSRKPGALHYGHEITAERS